VVSQGGIAAGRLQVMDGISTPHARDITGGQHPQTQITFLPHIIKVISIAAKFEKHIPAYCVGSAHECMNCVDTHTVRRALPDHVILPSIDKWDSDRAYARMIKFRECLLHGAR